MNIARHPNIFLIVLDTLRQDYSSPIIKELTELGFTSYENAIAPAPWTLPSHASMVTGLYPTFHGAHETKRKKDIDIRLNKHEFSFVNNLIELGYKSFLLSAVIYVSPYFGFKGFNRFVDTSIPRILNKNEEKIFTESHRLGRKKTTFSTLNTLLREKHAKLFLKVIVGYGLKRLKWPKDKGVTNTIYYLKKLLATNVHKNPLFVMINLFEVHEPYSKGEKVVVLRENNRKGHIPPERVIERWQYGYPKQVEYLKKKIVEITGLFKETGVFDDSLIIITSDHGQMLGEHGIIGHGTYLYDELLKVPLMIKYPQNKKVIINEQNAYISLIKIKPLILQTVYNNTINDSVLYSPIVFAESYGIPERIKPRSKEEQEYVNSLEKYKIAVYGGKEKAIFNVSDWKFETSPKPNNPEIKQAVMNFLKTSTLNKNFKSDKKLDRKNFNIY